MESVTELPLDPAVIMRSFEMLLLLLIVTVNALSPSNESTFSTHSEISLNTWAATSSASASLRFNLGDLAVRNAIG